MDSSANISTASFSYAPDAHTPEDWQKALIDQLSVLDEVCKAHGITYFICFGGLLGAARHKDIIPWDNDVDVVMTEKNYNKLVQLHLDGKLPAGYVFASTETEAEHPLLFGRFINLNTSCPLSTSAFNGNAHGVFIDVFRLFPMPEDERLLKDAHTDFLVWEEYLCYMQRRCSSRTDLFIERWKEAEAYESEHGRKRTLAMLEQKFRSKLPDWDETSKCIWSSGGKRDGYPVLETSWFAEAIELPLGDKLFPAPIGYHELLNRLYGAGWRMLPTGESFHAYSCANLNIPSYVVTADYMQFINQHEAKRAFSTYKRLLMDDMVAKHERKLARLRNWASRAAGKLSASLETGSFVQQLSKKSTLQSEGLDLRMYLDAEKAVRPVFDTQFSGPLARERCALPLQQSLLTAALWARFLVKEDFWTVSDFIAIQLADKERSSFSVDIAENALLIACLEETAKLYDAIDRKHIADIRQINGKLQSLCPRCLHATIARTYLAYVDRRFEDSIEEADTALEIWRQNDYLSFLKACSLAETGQAESCRVLFDSIAKTSNNGMILSSIIEKTSVLGFKETMQAAVERLRHPLPTSAQKENSQANTRSISFALKRALHSPCTFLKEQHACNRIKAKLSNAAQVVDTCLRYRRLTDNRFFVWERMYPRKRTILHAAKAGDRETMRKLSRAYLEAVYRLMDNDGMGLCIDMELQNALLPLVREDRGDTFVERFLASIPPEHKEDIDMFLRRQGVNHPYAYPGSDAELA